MVRGIMMLARGGVLYTTDAGSIHSCHNENVSRHTKRSPGAELHTYTEDTLTPCAIRAVRGDPCVIWQLFLRWPSCPPSYIRTAGLE